MIRFRTHVRRGETGAGLILALMFLSILAVGALALLAFADTSVRATVGVRSQANTSSAADGAVQAAINAIRPTATLGAEGQPCPIPVIAGVTISCVALPGSGGTTVVDTSSDTPGQALLTLSTSALEDGIAQSSNNTLTVGGKVFSNSTINVQAGPAKMQVTGTVASHSCPGAGTITSTVTGYPVCNTSTVMVDPGIGDPTYNPPTPVATLQTPPATCGTGTVTLSPGTYTSAALLSNLTSGACTLVFTPGPYLFAFADASPIWTFTNKDAHVIGGTVAGAGCDASVANGGVQFMFDGASRISSNDGTITLCASPDMTHQRIAIYGLKPTTSTPATIVATTASSASSPSFASPNNGLLVDGSLATATLDKNSATEVVQNYSSPAIPAGSTIDSAVLRLRHSEPTPGNMSLTIAATTGGTTVLNASPGACSALCDYISGELKAILNTPTKIAGVQVTYTATTTKTPRTANLDGVVLDVTYHTSPYAGESGCITVIGAGNCPLILTNGNFTNMFVTGTTYAPLARFDVSLPNQSQQIFGRGLIARSLSISIPNSAAGGASIYAPSVSSSTSSTNNRDVLFTATIGGKVVLRARVMYDDTSVPGVPGENVTVMSWSVVR